MRNVTFAWAIIALYLGFSTPAHAQNLVLNSSFEVLDSCPPPGFSASVQQYVRYCFDIGFTENPGGGNPTPDTWSTCTSWDIAFNNSGIARPPRTGNTCAGIVTYYHDNFYDIKYREYIGMTLSEPLKKDTSYYVSFYVRTAEFSSYVCNNMGIYFAYQKPLLFLDTINDRYSFILDSVPQIIHKEVVYSYEWTKIQGSFTAKGGERYLVIGNMFDDDKTEAIPLSVQSSEQVAYYVIDDVCVSAKANECEVSTSIIDKPTNNQVIVYPNPAQTTLYMKNLPSKSILALYNQKGELVIQENAQNTLSVAQYPEGLYFLHIITPTQRYIQKIIIQH